MWKDFVFIIEREDLIAMKCSEHQPFLVVGPKTQSVVLADPIVGSLPLGPSSKALDGCDRVAPGPFNSESVEDQDASCSLMEGRAKFHDGSQHAYAIPEFKFIAGMCLFLVAFFTPASIIDIIHDDILELGPVEEDAHVKLLHARLIVRLLRLDEIGVTEAMPA